MANVIANALKKNLADKLFDWTADSIKCLLVTSANDFDKDNTFLSDIANLHELSGTGYSRKTLGTMTVTRDDSLDVTILDAADVVWTAINAGVAAAVIIFKEESASEGARRVLCKIDTGGFPFTTNGGDFTIQWNSGGVIQLA
jgi:hypothetical protein